MIETKWTLEHLNEICVRQIPQVDRSFLICGKPRTGITGLIPYCEEHYQEVWGKH